MGCGWVKLLWVVKGFGQAKVIGICEGKEPKHGGCKVLCG